MSDFLHDILSNPFVEKNIATIPVPTSISDNIKKGFGERAYQQQAFKRFIFFNNEDFQDKQNKPYHLLYNMATGSGKTTILKWFETHLYEQGYRNFLFFVNSTNIINKTKDNFLNSSASKYLFFIPMILCLSKK